MCVLGSFDTPNDELSFTKMSGRSVRGKWPTSSIHAHSELECDCIQFSLKNALKKGAITQACSWLISVVPVNLKAGPHSEEARSTETFGAFQWLSG